MGADGMTVKEVAARLGITPQTVHNHLKALKLGSHVTKRGNALRLDPVAVEAVAHSTGRELPEEEDEPPADNEREELLRELTALREEADGLRAEVKDLRSSNREKDRTIRELGREVAALTSLVSRLQEKVGRLQEGFLIYRSAAYEMLGAPLMERLRRFPHIRRLLPLPPEEATGDDEASA